LTPEQELADAEAKIKAEPSSFPPSKPGTVAKPIPVPLTDTERIAKLESDFATFKAQVQRKVKLA